MTFRFDMCDFFRLVVKNGQTHIFIADFLKKAIMICKHETIIPMKISKSRTLLKCFECDYVIGSWEEIPQHSKPKEIIGQVRKLTNRELESLR